MDNKTIDKIIRDIKTKFIDKAWEWQFKCNEKYEKYSYVINLSIITLIILIFTYVILSIVQKERSYNQNIQPKSMIEFEVKGDPDNSSMVENAGKAVGEAGVNAIKGIGKGIWKGVVGESKPLQHGDKVEILSGEAAGKIGIIVSKNQANRKFCVDYSENQIGWIAEVEESELKKVNE